METNALPTKAPAGANTANENNFNEFDIPSEWRIPEGAILQELTDAESEAIELDRR